MSSGKHPMHAFGFKPFTVAALRGAKLFLCCSISFSHRPIGTSMTASICPPLLYELTVLSESTPVLFGPFVQHLVGLIRKAPA